MPSRRRLTVDLVRELLALDLGLRPLLGRGVCPRRKLGRAGHTGTGTRSWRCDPWSCRGVAKDIVGGGDAVARFWVTRFAAVAAGHTAGQFCGASPVSYRGYVC